MAVYVGSAFLNRHLTKPNPPGQKKGPLRKYFLAFLWGLGAILVADQLSQETPLWPALTFITLLGGMMFPFFKDWRKTKSYYGLSGYWGGLLYLDPWLFLVAFFLAIEIYVITRDRLAGATLFVSLIPIMLSYARWNPGFIWAAAAIGLMTLLYFYPEFRQRWCDLWKPAPGQS